MSAISPLENYKVLLCQTFYWRLSIYDTAKSIAFTKIVTILPQNVEFFIAIMTCDSNILAQVFYQDQSIVKLIGDVIRPIKKCRGEKGVYLTSLEEINKNTYECKQCKSCSHVFSIHFKDQKPYVNFFGWIFCFRKNTKLIYQTEKLSTLRWQYFHQSRFSSTKAEEPTNKPVPKRQRYYRIWNNRVRLILSVLLQHIFTFSSSSNFSQTDNTLLYNQQKAIYSFQQRNTVDFGLWSWFSSSESKGSIWKPFNQFPGNFFGSPVFVAVPKARIFGQSLASSSHNSQPTGNFWNERQSTL